MTSSAQSVSGWDGMPTTPYAWFSSGVTCTCAGAERSLEEALRELAEAEAGPRLGQRVSLREPAAEEPPRLGVREVDDEILVDREHSLVEALEQQAAAGRARPRGGGTSGAAGGASGRSSARAAPNSSRKR